MTGAGLVTGAGLWAAALVAAAVAVLLSPRAGAQRLGRLRVGSAGRAAGGRGVTAGTRPGQKSWLTGSALLAWTVTLVLLVVGLVPAVLAAAAAVAGRRWQTGRQRAAARERERARAVEACAALAAELRSGRAPDQALMVAAELACGPSARSLAAAAAAARLGGDVAAALRPEPPVPGSTGTAVPEVLRALSACWTVCANTGSGLASAVERLEQGLRAQAAQRRAVQAELAGPRATAGLLAVLPLAGLVLAAGLGADPLRVLLHTPLGLVCLVTGLGLDLLGVLWVGRLVARAGGS